MCCTGCCAPSAIAASTGCAPASARRGWCRSTPTTAGCDNATDPLWARRLQRLLLQLPAAPRAVVTLRFQEDLEPTEIAAALDMPVNTVKSHLRRSLEWLRAQQAGDGHGH